MDTAERRTVWHLAYATGEGHRVESQPSLSPEEESTVMDTQPPHRAEKSEPLHGGGGRGPKQLRTEFGQGETGHRSHSR